MGGFRYKKNKAAMPLCSKKINSNQFARAK